MYLKAQDHTNEQEGVTVTKYIWGPRATLEFSKWSLFKHVIKVCEYEEVYLMCIMNRRI